MAEQVPPNTSQDFWHSIILLLTGGGFSGVVLAVIRAYAARLKNKEDKGAKATETYVKNLRDDNRLLTEDLRVAQERMRVIDDAYRVREDALEDQIRKLNRTLVMHMRASVELEMESKLLRVRHVRMRAYCMALIGDVAKRLSLPEEELGLPRWIDESVEGPTEHALQIVPPYDPPRPTRILEDTDA